MDSVSRWRYRALAGFFGLVVLSAAAGVAPTVRALIETAPYRAAQSQVASVVTFSEDFGGSLPVKYVKKTVKFGAGTLGGLAGDLIRGGLATAAIVAVVEAAGWAIDELQHEVVAPGVPFDHTFDGVGYSTVMSGHQYMGGDPCALTKAIASASFGFHDVTCSSLVQLSGGQVQQNYCHAGDCNFHVIFSTSTGTHTCPDGGYYDPDSQICGSASAGDPVSVTDAQLGDAVVERGSPSLWHDLLTNDQTGIPVETPEILAAENQLRDLAISSAGDDPTAFPDQTAADPSDPVPTGAPSDDDSSSEQPPTLPDNPAVPFVDVPVPSGWTSALGSSGSCPDPVAVPLWDGQSFDITWDVPCTVADWMRPILLLVAYVSAAGIVLGLRRG